MATVLNCTKSETKPMNIMKTCVEAFWTLLGKSPFTVSLPPQVGRRDRNLLALAAFSFAIAAIIPCSSHAQGVITNGLSHQGAIAVAGGINSWTFTAAAGDHMTLQIAKLSGGATFVPMIELFGPDG